MKEIDGAIELFENGIYDNSIDTIFKWADKGNIKALSCLGLAYHFGLGVDRDLEKASENLERAAKKGSGVAAHNLGTLFLEPDFLNPRLSKYWYNKAKELGFIVAPEEWYQK
jgi:TPR repeat protein